MRAGLSLFFLLVACADTGDAASPVAREPEPLTGNAGSDAGTAIPTTPDALKTWLLAGSYKSWSAESAPHPSAGPHASSVLTFVNDDLKTSLASSSKEHPAGAAAVKEFLGPTGVKGWAVAVKTQASSADGDGWYWYETFSTAPGVHGIHGQGAAVCVNCHDGGTDFVLTPFPLR